jgi:putative peptidoglycan lipid II flippase
MSAPDEMATTLNLKRTAQSEQVARSAGVVSIAIFMSRLTGLVREMVMAQKFGAGFSYDAFLLGFRIPNLTRDLFAEGALSSAFVPTFTKYLAEGDKEGAARLSNLVATAIIAIVGLICLLGVIFAPVLVWLLAPGFAAVPGKFELAVQMTRIMFPFLLLVALAAQAMGMLNACNVFGVPALASTFFNLGSVIFGLALGVYIGPHIGMTAIEGMAYGVVLGGALQLVWQIPSLRSAGFAFKLDFQWSHPGLQQIFRLMIPAILGNAAVQINVMVNTNFASRLSDPLRGPDGPVSWLAYAFRFMQLPLGLFGVAFAAAVLPSVSRSAASANYEEFRKTLSRSLNMVFLLTIPSSIGLVVLGRPIIGAIFQGGKFQFYDTQQTAIALSCYAVGLVGYAATKMLNPAFYALDEANTPMFVSLLSILVNFGVACVLLFVFHLGHAALALSTSVVAIVASLVLFERLRRRLGGIEGRYLMHGFTRIAAGSILMALPVWASSFQMTRWLGVSRWADLANLAVSLPVGLLAFVIILRYLKIDEVHFALDVFVSPFVSRIQSLRAKIRE